MKIQFFRLNENYSKKINFLSQFCHCSPLFLHDYPETDTFHKKYINFEPAQSTKEK